MFKTIKDQCNVGVLRLNQHAEEQLTKVRMKFKIQQPKAMLKSLATNENGGFVEWLFVIFIAVVIGIGIYTLITGKMPAFVDSIFNKFTGM